MFGCLGWVTAWCVLEWVCNFVHPWACLRAYVCVHLSVCVCLCHYVCVLMSACLCLCDCLSYLHSARSFLLPSPHRLGLLLAACHAEEALLSCESTKAFACPKMWGVYYTSCRLLLPGMWGSSHAYCLMRLPLATCRAEKAFLTCDQPLRIACPLCDELLSD